MAQIKDLIVTGASRFLGNIYGTLKGNADTSTKATQDSAGQQINTTYIKGLSVSGRTITYTKGDGKTGTITTQDNNTTYTAGTGLSLSGTTFNHKNSVTAATAQGDANKTLTFGGTFTIPTITYDAQGHITSKGTTTMTMPANPNTDTHWTTGITAGETGTISNSATTNGNTFIKIKDNSTHRGQIKLVGSGATSVSSNAEGVITISSTDNNTTYGSMSVSEGTTGTATTNRVLTAANLKGIINAHAPTKTGGGASGTWGISISGNAATASKVNNKLTVGSKSYDGSAAVTIEASDLGLASAMLFLGTTTTAITDGATTNPVAIGGSNKTVTAGNVVLYGSKEFVWTGSAWEELGNEGSYKIVQAAVADPSASGTSNTFIDTISQDTNGKITATKKTVAVTNSAPTLAWNTTSTIGTVAGTNLQVKMPANPNTDTKVTQTVTTSNAAYPLLLAPNGQTATTTTTSYFDSGVTLNPSTNTIEANISGNASTATKLATARTIWGQSFNGTANISGNMTGVGNINTATAPAGTVYMNNWFRSTGATGWYNETYGGGWYMTDSTYIRNYNSKTTRLDNLCLGADNNSYRLYVNGNSYFNGNTTHNGTDYFANGTSFYIDDSADANLRRGLFAGTSNADTDASSFFHTGALEVRESGRVGTAQSSFNYAPRIGFHWSGRIAATLSFHSDGIFYLRKQNGSDRATLDANLNGSSDMLDGYHESSFLRYSGWWYNGSGQNVNDASGMIFAYNNHGLPGPWGVVTTFDYSKNSEYRHQIFGDCWSNDMYFRTCSSDRGGWGEWRRLVYESGTWGISISGNANTATRAEYLGDKYSNDKHGANGNGWYSIGEAQITEGNYMRAPLAINWYWGIDMRACDVHHLRINGARVWSEGMSVTGAVWNDYAEYREADTTQGGRCVIEVGDDTLTLTTKRLMRGCSITSDTWGFAQGETDKAKTPIAVAGRVLAYPLEDRELFKEYIGYSVCSGPDGTVSLMTEEEELKYPWAIVGTVSAVPDYEEWGGGEMADRPSVKVDGRIWIKVK